MEILIKTLKERFGWRTGASFTAREFEGLIQAGDEVKQAIEHWLPGMDGDAWIRKNLGNVVFHKGGLPQNVVSLVNGKAKISLVFINHHIWLYPRLFNTHRPTQWVIHELGHVLDNNHKWMSIWWGGGPSDALMWALNTHPSGLRWANTKALAKEMPADFSWTKHNQGKLPNYGDNSSADYFAETWTWSIFRPEVIPLPARDWFMDWMRDQSLTMVES